MLRLLKKEILINDSLSSVSRKLVAYCWVHRDSGDGSKERMEAIRGTVYITTKFKYTVPRITVPRINLVLKYG